MIPLALPAVSDAREPFITRLSQRGNRSPGTAVLFNKSEEFSLWSSDEGLIEVLSGNENLDGDVVLVDPEARKVERILRAGSPHNTLLVTEQCDQLCVMCSQPPKKRHLDRFELFKQACLLADPSITIGVSGGEPTLHIDALMEFLESVLAERPDLTFHVLTNAQHFQRHHVDQLRGPAYRNVVWGIPLYSADPAIHDQIVRKPGAFERLLTSFNHLIVAAARIELRTVLLTQNVAGLEQLALFVAHNLPQVEQWSLMDLENVGFARPQFAKLRVPLRQRFGEVTPALDRAILHGVPVRLFNMPLCHLPAQYRQLATASISDWKQKFGTSCGRCRSKSDCSGFFEWHPNELVEDVVPL